MPRFFDTERAVETESCLLVELDSSSEEMLCSRDVNWVLGITTLKVDDSALWLEEMLGDLEVCTFFDLERRLALLASRSFRYSSVRTELRSGFDERVSDDGGQTVPDSFGG